MTTEINDFVYETIRTISREYDIPDAHIKDATLSAYCCPKCRGRGRWRTAVHFDHEKICCDLRVVWCPEDIEAYRERLARELAGSGGDGI